MAGLRIRIVPNRRNVGKPRVFISARLVMSQTAVCRRLWSLSAANCSSPARPMSQATTAAISSIKRCVQPLPMSDAAAEFCATLSVNFMGIEPARENSRYQFSVESVATGLPRNSLNPMQPQRSESPSPIPLCAQSASTRPPPSSRATRPCRSFQPSPESPLRIPYASFGFSSPHR